MGDIHEQPIRQHFIRSEPEPGIPEKAELDGKAEAIGIAMPARTDLDVVDGERVVPDEVGVIAGDTEHPAPVVFAEQASSRHRSLLAP